MTKNKTLKRVIAGLLAFVLVAGAAPADFGKLDLFSAAPVTAYAEENETAKVTLDFTSNNWNFPTNQTKGGNSYSYGDYSVTLYAPSSGNYRYISNYLLVGKSGAYLELPAFDFDVEKIVVTGNAGASERVYLNVFVNDTAVSTQTTGIQGTQTYEINENYQAKGYKYRLKVNNNYNAQFTKIEIFEKKTSTVDVTGVTLDQTETQTINVGGKVAFTATVAPNNATDKKVKWSVGGTNADAVTLYTDEACTAGNEVGTAATDVLTVYAKGVSAGSATVTATSNADSTKTASCGVNVLQPTYIAQEGDDIVLHLSGLVPDHDGIDPLLREGSYTPMSITKVVSEEGAVLPVNCTSLFYNFSNVKSIDLSNADTSRVTNMSQMFSKCSSLTDLDLGDNFDTSGVTNMLGMFKSCSSLTSLDLGENFSTGSISSQALMTSMFIGCNNLSEIKVTSKFSQGISANMALPNGDGWYIGSDKVSGSGDYAVIAASNFSATGTTTITKGLPKIDLSNADVTVNKTTGTVSVSLDGTPIASGCSVKYYKAGDETDEGTETFPTQGGKYIAKITAAEGSNYEGEKTVDFVVDKLIEGTHKITTTKDGKPYTRVIFVVPKTDIAGVQSITFTVTKDGVTKTATSKKYYSGSALDDVTYTSVSSEYVLLCVSVSNASADQIECSYTLNR